MNSNGDRVAPITVHYDEPLSMWAYWDVTFAGGVDNTGVVRYTDALGQSVDIAVISGCRGMTSIRGTAYEDMNANGKREADEPVFGGAWYKITDGGNWFTCGAVGGDGTYGVPVMSGRYHVVPINLPGFRATAHSVSVLALGGRPALATDIGYVRDANAQLESCDGYHPARPIN